MKNRLKNNLKRSKKTPLVSPSTFTSSKENVQELPLADLKTASITKDIAKAIRAWRSNFEGAAAYDRIIKEQFGKRPPT